MINQVVQFLAAYEIWIYAVLGVIALGAASRLFKAINYWHNATFGIEKEIGKRKFSSALATLGVLFFFAMSEFVFVTFSGSVLPDTQMIATPTLDVLATATPTLAPTSALLAESEADVTPTPELENCIPGEIEITYPANGDQISGVVQILGTANSPNFGFLKYEYTNAGGEVWTTVAGKQSPVIEGEIGLWNTTQLISGDYQLRVVVLDNQNAVYGACIVTVRVVVDSEE